MAFSYLSDSVLDWIKRAAIHDNKFYVCHLLEKEIGNNELYPLIDLATHTSEKFVACSSDINNLNGDRSHSPIHHEYQYFNTTIFTQNKNDWQKPESPEIQLTTAFKVSGMGGDPLSYYDFNISVSSSAENYVEASSATSFTSDVNVDTPSGKVYRAIVIAERQTVSVPAEMRIEVSGVIVCGSNNNNNNNNQNESTSVESIGHWFQRINELNINNQKSSFRRDGNYSSGVAIRNCTLSGTQIVNFKSMIIDVTASYLKKDSPEYTTALADYGKVVTIN